MSKARDLANAGTALGAVTATELGYVDGVTSAIQTQIDAKEATLPSQTGNSGKYLTTNGSAKSWGTVSQYALPSQTGNSGKYLTTNGTAESWGTVTAPRKWTPAATANNTMTDGSYFGTVRTKIVYGNGYYVFAANNGNVWASNGGTDWTFQQVGTGNFYGIAFGNGTFVLTNDAGGIYTATNPTSTWTSRTSPFTAGGPGIYEATYVAGSINLFLIGMSSSSAASQGILASSSDGITWTNRKFSTAASQGINSIAHDNSTIFASTTPQAQCAYSTNGTSWTTFNPGTGESIEYFSGALSRFVGLSSNAANCISQTAANISTVWTTTPTTNFSMHTDTPSMRGATNPTSAYGNPMYDSVRNRYYVLANISGGQDWYLNTYDASTLVTIAATSGTRTIYSYKLIDSEILPFGYRSDVFTNVTLGYGNNKIIYAASNTSSGMRIFYADIA
jgi:hypothetical protein